jgi:hypothetical protein
VSSEFIDTVTESYDCVVLPLFTNDVRDSENTESVSSEFELLVKKIHRKWSEAKMLIAMGISRGDSVMVNNKILEYNIILQHLFLHVDFITLCDNSNISIRGQPNYRFLKDDKVHLNGYGIKVFVSNLKYSLRKILNIQVPRKYNSNIYHTYNNNWYGGKGPTI